MQRSVQLLVTCLVDSLFPEVGEAVVRVLSRAGVRVEFPKEQTCCGQPAFNGGYWGEAKRMAKHTIEVFEQSPYAVVVPSGSCAAMIAHGYLELFADEVAWLPRAKALAERTYELSQYLVDVVGTSELGAAFSGRLAYHPSCHLLRGLGVEEQPLTLLRAVKGAQIEPLKAECCGFGGVFSVDHGEISGEMLGRKLQDIEEQGVDGVVACDVSCLMQIEGGLRKAGKRTRCAHLAQVLVGGEMGLR